MKFKFTFLITIALAMLMVTVGASASVTVSDHDVGISQGMVIAPDFTADPSSCAGNHPATLTDFDIVCFNEFGVPPVTATVAITERPIKDTYWRGGDSKASRCEAAYGIFYKYNSNDTEKKPPLEFGKEIRRLS